MSTERLEAILERHEKLLWWMTDQARFAFIAELREDYLFEDELRRVSECMSWADTSLELPQQSSDHFLSQA